MEAKKIVLNFYNSYNQKDLDKSFNDYISKKLVNHAFGGYFDREKWLEGDKPLFTAFEDFSMVVLDQVAEGNKVVTRWVIKGKHIGEYYGKPASGNIASFEAICIDLVADGKIVEHWLQTDFTSFLKQLDKK